MLDDGIREGFSGRRARGGWLDEVDWPAVLDDLSRAERAVAILDDRFSASPMAEAWIDATLHDEAVAEARAVGLITTRERLRLYASGRHDWAGTHADVEAARVLRVLEGAFERHRLGNVDQDGAEDMVLSSGREVAEMDDLRRIVTLRSAGHEGGEEAARTLMDVVGAAMASARRLPPLIRGFAVVWSVHEAGGFWNSEGRTARLLFPLAVRWRSRRPPPPLVLGHAFSARPESMAPGTDATRWTRTMLRAVASSASAGLLRLERLERLLALGERALSSKRSNSRAAMVHKLLVAREVATIDCLVEAMARDCRADATHRGVGKIVAELVELGLAREVSGRRSYRLYAADTFSLDGASDAGSRAPRRPDLPEAPGSAKPAGPPPERVPPLRTADDDKLADLVSDADDASSRVAALIAKMQGR